MTASSGYGCYHSNCILIISVVVAANSHNCLPILLIHGLGKCLAECPVWLVKPLCSSWQNVGILQTSFMSKELVWSIIWNNYRTTVWMRRRGTGLINEYENCLDRTILVWRWAVYESVAMAAATVGLPRPHALKYRTSIATPLATAVAIAEVAILDTALYSVNKIK